MIIKLCLFITAWLPYLSKLIVASAMNKEGFGYDNAYPREQQKRLTGYGARAVAAHQNSFEALLFFGLAAILVLVCQKENMVSSFLSILFVCARVCYHVAYLMNLSTMRSFVWFIGFFCCLTMYIMCLT